MSHNNTVVLAVRPLRGRSHVDVLPPQVKTWALSPLRYESGKAERRIVRPLWGLTAGRSGAIRHLLFTKKMGTNTKLIPIDLNSIITRELSAKVIVHDAFGLYAK